jgi:hypothetical protein
MMVGVGVGGGGGVAVAGGKKRATRVAIEVGSAGIRGCGRGKEVGALGGGSGTAAEEKAMPWLGVKIQ